MSPSLSLTPHISQAPEGIHTVCRRFPRLKIVTSEIDAGINDHYRVVPGMGEFGDRYFGTDADDDDDDDPEEGDDRIVVREGGGPPEQRSSSETSVNSNNGALAGLSLQGSSDKGEVRGKDKDKDRDKDKEGLPPLPAGKNLVSRQRSSLR